MAFTGLIATFPVGLTGFNGSRNMSKLGPGHFSYVEGVDIDGGVLVKDGGASKLNAVAMGGAVLAGRNWSPVPGANHDIVVLSNGTMRKDVGLGTFPTLLGSVGVPTVFPPFFVRAGGEKVGSTRKLFVFNEAQQLQYISGTADVLTTVVPPADWSGSFPIFGVQHNQRLWAGGNGSDPHRIYYSQTGRHTDFLGVVDPLDGTPGSLAIYPGEGDQLVGGISFRGLLILFKYPTGIYVVDTRDPTVANWRVDKLNDAVGVASPHCLVQISNDVILLDNGGNFHVMSTVTDFSDIRTSDIGQSSVMGPFMRENVGLTDIRKAMGVWYAAKAKAWFMVPLAGSTFNNLRIVVDFNDANAGPRYLLSRRDEGPALWMRPDTIGVRRPTLGDPDGFVWLMDRESRNKDGVAYTMAFDTSENDFGFLDPQLAPRTKNGDFLEIVADLVRNTTLTVTPTWDGFVGQPIVFNIGSSGAALGSFILDTDVLSSTGIVISRGKLDGQGRRLKLSVVNDILDDELRLAEVRVGFKVADERIRYE